MANLTEKQESQLIESDKEFRQIIKEFGSIVVHESYKVTEKQLLPRWYVSNAYLVKMTGKKVYLFIQLSSTESGSYNQIAIRVLKTTTKFSKSALEDKETGYKLKEQITTGFLLDDWSNYMNTEKLAKRLRGLKTIL